MFRSKIPTNLNKKNSIFPKVLVLIAIIVGSLYLNSRVQKKITPLSSIEAQQKLEQKEIETLVSKVKKHILLPDNETPTLAKVTNASVLKNNQPFFKKVQNGDEVLFYIGAKKVIVYRPNADLIVDIGSITVDENNQKINLTIEVRNGTETTGLGRKIADSLESMYVIKKVDDATKKNYTRTIIVKMNKSSNIDMINRLAQTLKAEVVFSLPEGEATSPYDVIIIVGTDKVSD